MSEQKPPRSTNRGERTRPESSTDGSQMSAERSSKAISRQRSPKRRSRSLRAGLAVVGGRAAGALSRRLHLGGGTSIAGLVAQRL